MSLLRLVSSSSHDMMEHVHRKFVEGKKIPFQVQVYKSSSDDRTEPILIAPSRNAIGQLEIGIALDTNSSTEILKMYCL